MHDYGQSLLRKTKLKPLIAERLGQSVSNGIKAGQLERKNFTLVGLQTFGRMAERLKLLIKIPRFRGSI